MQLITKLLHFILSFGLVMGCIISTATADSDIDESKLIPIESFLHSITTFQAPFIQSSSDGTLATGIFYLSRPGKLRWEYNPPTPVSIVLKGGILAYYDKELDELSHIPVDSVIAGFLADKDISLTDDELNILDYQSNDENISLTIAKKDHTEEGSMTIVVEKQKGNALRLSQIEVLDPIGKLTTVTFKDGTYDAPIPDDTFSIDRKNKRRLNN